MKSGRSLDVTPATGNGLYAQPQKSAGTSYSQQVRVQQDEPLPLVHHTENKAKDGVIDMLTEKCTKLQSQLEKAKALRSALHEQVEHLTLGRDELMEEFQKKQQEVDKEIGEKDCRIETLQKEVERLQIRAESAEASLEPTTASITTLKEKLATERHKRELAEMTLGRERRQWTLQKEQQDHRISELEQHLQQRPGTAQHRPVSSGGRGEANTTLDSQLNELEQRCAELEALLEERDEKIEDLTMDLETEREWRLSAQEEKSGIQETMEGLKEQYQQMADHAGKTQSLNAGKEEELNQLRDLVSSLQAARQTDQERLDQMKKKSRNSQAKAKIEVSKEKDQKIRELESKLQDAENRYSELRVNSNERVKKYKARVEELRKRLPKTDARHRPGSREENTGVINPRPGNHTDQFPSPVSSTSAHTKQDDRFAEDSDIPEWMRY